MSLTVKRVCGLIPALFAKHHTLSMLLPTNAFHAIFLTAISAPAIRCAQYASTLFRSPTTEVLACRVKAPAKLVRHLVNALPVSGPLARLLVQLAIAIFVPIRIANPVLKIIRITVQFVILDTCI